MTNTGDDELLPAEQKGRPLEARNQDDLPPAPASKEHKPPANVSRPSAMQGLADCALEFLAHASNETLGACFVGLGAATYMILGRVGLVIMSVAGGVVLHATWEGIRGDTRDEQAKAADLDKKRETSLDIVKRTLEWRQPSADPGSSIRRDTVWPTPDVDFSSFGALTETALNAFVDAIIKDYVLYWYAPTLPGEESFPVACRRTLTAFLLSLSNHLHRKRPADVFLDFVTNASSIIIVFLNELSAALRASPNASAEDAIATYLELKPESSLAYMLDQRAQNIRLTDAAEDILQAYLDPKSYNCAPVQVFLKQVLAQLVLGYTVSYCSKPEWINDWIVYGLEESETAKEVMDIVDAGVEGRDAPNQLNARTDLDQDRPTMESRKERDSAALLDEPSPREHKRHMSKAEEAMDDAMREARRLTQLMIEEDEKRRREQQDTAIVPSGSEDVSDQATQGIITPSSSQSDTDADARRPRENKDSLDGENSFSAIAPQFTSFDQLLPDPRPTALLPERTQTPPLLTLHNASVTIYDDSVRGEKASMKVKPTTDFLIQIEPAASVFPGWMIARKYADFETLHEVLRRISVITGVPQFTAAHAELPKWKTQTKAGLTSKLERYLTDAIRFQPLAESEGMKRFLEKDQAMSRSPGQKGFGWPTPDAFGKLGGEMMNVLTKAPKQVAGGVAGGGKAVFGGVAGLVGGVAGAKKALSQSQATQKIPNTVPDPSVDQAAPHSPEPKTSQVLQQTATGLDFHSPTLARPSTDSVQSFPELKSSTEDGDSIAPTPVSKEELARTSAELPEAIEERSTHVATEPVAEEALNLPPRPSEMPDDFHSADTTSNHQTTLSKSSLQEPHNTDGGFEPQSPARSVQADAIRNPQASTSPKKAPLSEREASVAIELMFAVITELYTLSSAWNIRRTLLTAAKTYLLRPGNPQLASIRDLLQDSLLDNNLSDEGLAEHVHKLRANSLPTAEELEAWTRDYPEKDAEQKDQLRIKARRLLVSKGMPQALSSVMGAAASGEALGKVFDCLQIEHVSRGLIFGLVLQALRLITQ